MGKRIIFMLVFVVIGGAILFSQIKDFPKTMYVNSKEGLRKRTEPSLTSKRIGILPNGARIVVLERSTSAETIDGMTDYWYKTDGGMFDGKWYKETWVFGGYLSEMLPLDVPAILGRWDDKEKEDMYIYFFADGMYWEGKKETDVGLGGKWVLKGNKVNITYLQAGLDDLKPSEYKTIAIGLNVIDRDNIEIIWPDNKISRLKRNNDAW